LLAPTDEAGLAGGEGKSTRVCEWSPQARLMPNRFLCSHHRSLCAYRSDALRYQIRSIKRCVLENIIAVRMLKAVLAVYVFPRL